MPKLYEAFKKARVAKRGTYRQQVFEMYFPIYISNLAMQIANRKYEVGSSKVFIIEDPTKREIFASCFEDTIINHFLFDMVYKWWDKRFIYDSYACRKQKGTLFGIKRLAHHIKSVSENYANPTYVLKLDLEGYFMSLPRKGLYKQVMWGLDRQFDKTSICYPILKYLFEKIIFHDPLKDVQFKCSKKKWEGLPKSKSLFYTKPGCGVVIGNLTSQLMSNIYLDQLDRYITLDLGIKHYGRYVDDFFMVSNDRQELLDVIPKIDKFLKSIGLKLHPKKILLQEINKGIPFLGAVIYPYRIHPSRRMKKNIYSKSKQYLHALDSIDYDNFSEDEIREYKNYCASMESYHGLTQHFNHYKLWRKVINPRGQT